MFVLASASPRRAELLRQIGVHDFTVGAVDIDESVIRGENPRLYAQRIARAKLAAAQLIHNNMPILCADTVVARGNRILGKPADAEQALKYLKILSGGRHRVYGAICLYHDGRVHERLVETRVKFCRLSDADMHDYLASNEWQGKAGGYAIQGRAGAFVKWINGSYSNIVGLSLPETRGLLQGAQLWR